MRIVVGTDGAWRVVEGARRWLPRRGTVRAGDVDAVLGRVLAAADWPFSVVVDLVEEVTGGTVQQDSA